jgi:D-alanyl-D-alanine carboxypeptidase-like protein
MGFLFPDKPRTYAPPPTPPAPTMLDQRPPGEPPPATGGRTVLRVDLPGRPGSYLDSEFAPKVDAFIRYAREAGHDITFSSADRTQATQDDIIKSGTGTTPAEQSLHSAGLAVDVDRFVKFPEAKQLAIRNAAERAGLSWGGSFTPKPDTMHFYFDPIPGQDRTDLINNFAEQVRRLQSKQ